MEIPLVIPPYSMRTKEIGFLNVTVSFITLFSYVIQTLLPFPWTPTKTPHLCSLFPNCFHWHLTDNKMQSNITSSIISDLSIHQIRQKKSFSKNKWNKTYKKTDYANAPKLQSEMKSIEFLLNMKVFAREYKSLF